MKLFVLLLLAILVLAANGKSQQRPSPLAGLPEYLVRHKLMKTYCEMLAGRRIHRVEELETRCVEKVQFFDENVNKGGNLLAADNSNDSLANSLSKLVLSTSH